jgi:2-hydroxychromene-2-carboxylate isomerase
LPARHAIVKIVDADNVEVRVAPRRMDEMIAANGRQVAIATDDRDHQLGVLHRDAQGKGNGAAMGRVVGIDVDVARRAPAAPDTGNADVAIFLIS